MAPTKAKNTKTATATKRGARLTLASTSPSTSTDAGNAASDSNDNQKTASASAETNSNKETAAKSASETSARGQAAKSATARGNARGKTAAKKTTARDAARTTKAATGKKRAASGATASARRSTEDAARTTRRASENVVNFSSREFRNAFERSAGEAQRVQETATRFGREGAQHMSRSATVASRAMNESVAIMQGNVETCMECGTIAADMTRKMSEEVFNFANNMFSSNVEISKDIFSCRTVNDVFDLQNRMFRSNLDNIFSESARLSEMMFDYINQAAEPIGDRISETTDRLTRSVAA